MPSAHIAAIMAERFNNEFCEVMPAGLDNYVGWGELSPSWRIAHTQGPSGTGIDYAYHIPRVYESNGNVAWPKQDATGISVLEARALLEDFCLFAH